MANRKRAGKRKQAPLTSQTLLRLVQEHPAVLKVLDKHGVTFCAGCFITLASPLEKAAAYHAVPDLKAFLRDLCRASCAQLK